MTTPISRLLLQPIAIASSPAHQFSSLPLASRWRNLAVNLRVCFRIVQKRFPLKAKNNLTGSGHSSNGYRTLGASTPAHSSLGSQTENGEVSMFCSRCQCCCATRTPDCLSSGGCEGQRGCVAFEQHTYETFQHLDIPACSPQFNICSRRDDTVWVCPIGRVLILNRNRVAVWLRTSLKSSKTREQATQTSNQEINELLPLVVQLSADDRRISSSYI